MMNRKDFGAEWQSVSYFDVRPVPPKNQRTRSVWLYGAICPARGVETAFVLSISSTKDMSLHLLEIAKIRSSGQYDALNP